MTSLKQGLKYVLLTETDILGGAATCSEGFVLCFLKVPLACWGSMAAAVQPNSLGTLRKRLTKPLGTSGRPTWYVLLSFSIYKRATAL